MSVITPKDLAGKTFSSAFKGYNKTEVDEYVTKVTKNYSALYRKCSDLEERLAVATLRLENISKDERKAKQTLESAKEKSDSMIAEAYERADDILVTIKKNCDAILRDFRKKVDAQKDALAEMNARVEYFKKDIFAKYRTHIEILEQICPPFDLEEDYTSNEYVMKVVNDLKHEISAEYDIAIGYDEEDPSQAESNFMHDAELDDMPTEEELSAFINDLTRKAIPQETVSSLPTEEIIKAEEKEEAENCMPEETFVAPITNAEEHTEITEILTPEEIVPSAIVESNASESNTSAIKDEYEKAIIIPSNKRPSRKKKKTPASVKEMLKKYEDEDLRQIPKIEAQLMLNLDDVTDSLIEASK